MPMPLLALALTSHLVLAADRVPSFDVNPTCSSASRAELIGKTDIKSCLDNENGARDQLAKRWSSFEAGDRTRCATLTQTGGPPSYIELLTCLEMSADARAMEQKERKAGTSDVGLYHSPKR